MEDDEFDMLIGIQLELTMIVAALASDVHGKAGLSQETAKSIANALDRIGDAIPKDEERGTTYNSMLSSFAELLRRERRQTH